MRRRISGLQSGLYLFANAATIALLAGLPNPVEAVQLGEMVPIHGRITDRQGIPIQRARVSLGEEQDFVLTGPDGRFQLLVPMVPFTLRGAAIGYHPGVISLAVGANLGAVNIALERAPIELPGVSVVGRTRAEVSAVPGATSIVGSATLHERAPISVADALRTVPGVHTASEDPFGLNLNLGFRGLPPRRSSRTLLMEDGVPILLGPYGDPSMHYAPPVEALDRIEIIKGSGQIASGPQTVGGIVNFVTRSPPLDGRYGEVTLGGGAHGYRNGHLWAGAGRDGYGISLDYTFREGDGVRYEQRHRFHNVLVNGAIPLSGNQSVTIKGAIWDEASRISETGLTQEEFAENPFSLPFTADGRFTVRRYLGQVVHEIDLGAGSLLTNAYLSQTTRASWRQSGESEERLGEDGYAEDFNCLPNATSYSQCGNQGRPRGYTVMGIEPRFSIDFGSASSGASLDIGARLYSEEVRRRQFVGNTPTSGEDDASLTRDNEIATTAVAAFVQTRLRLGAAVLSPAVRIERLAQEIGNRFPGSEAEILQSYTQLLPGLGATYRLAGGTTLFAGVHRGFAPPRPADVYQPEPGQAIVLVDPETSWNSEIGGRFEPRPGVGAEATFFRMDFGNEIIEAPAGEGQRFLNGGRTLHQGIEIGGYLNLGTLKQKPDDLALSGSFTYIPTVRFKGGDGRGEEIEGNRLPYAPRHLASASATFSHRSGFFVGTSLEHTGEQFADDENSVEPGEDGQDGLLPSYSIVHGFISYTIPGTRTRLRASVHNLFNELYITQRNEGIYTGMRRLMRVELHWTF